MQLVNMLSDEVSLMSSCDAASPEPHQQGRRKEKRMSSSKIPVRQIKPSSLIGRHLKLVNESVEKQNDRVIVGNESECNDRLGIEENGVQTSESGLCGNTNKVNGEENVEETAIDTDNNTTSSSTSSNSDSVAMSKLNETILEAPEPFQTTPTDKSVQVDDALDSNVMVVARLHDDVNRTAPETGDTTHQPPTDRECMNDAAVGTNECGSCTTVQNPNPTNCLTNNRVGLVEDNVADNSPPIGINTLKMTDNETMAVDDGDVCAKQLVDRPETVLQVAASIECGVAQCAQTSGCSRVTAANNTTPIQQQTTQLTNNTEILSDEQPQNESSEKKRSEELCWRFKNGRLVFETAERKSVLDEQVVGVEQRAEDEEDKVEVLYSRDLNKPKSRLKYLESKLKQAGITFTDNVLDANQNIVSEVEGFCQFDVRQVDANLTRLNNGFYCEVYDELEENEVYSNSSSSSECDSSCDETYCRINVNRMGTDGEKSKHNPDKEHLRSLLKKPGKTKEKKSNRVVFNETKNEFFDADYIILIREECDYDEEDDDGVCTCNQHEMVRLQCCEPNCNCGYGEQMPQSPKFAPPIEFVDAVTLSPPEGYKDMELGEEELMELQRMRQQRGQRAAVCRECSATHEDDEDGDECQSDTEEPVRHQTHSDEHEEKEKTDQSQQTTPTTPPNDSDNPNYILETITMTTVTEHRIVHETEDAERQIPSPNLQSSSGSPISGILKGGRLWKQQSLDAATIKSTAELQQIQNEQGITSDEENGSRRSVRFIETESKRDSCDGAPDNPPDEVDSKPPIAPKPTQSTSPESTEMMLTFKLGNHVLISNNSLKPNSAVRQLFPCTKPMPLKQGEESDASVHHQYLVTAESLRAFEEAKRSKLPQIIQSGDTDESIKRAIERNTLRRSLIRYEPRPKKPVQKTDNSLVERIKQLTCDVDNVEEEMATARVSPPGEEARNSPEVHTAINKSFSPSSSSTTSSNSSSMSSTYRKITDLFGKRVDKLPDVQSDTKIVQTLAPDLGGPAQDVIDGKLNAIDSRRQFLAPLTACVSSMSMNADDYYYHLSSTQMVGERASVASSVGTEYSLEDIDEGLKNGMEEENKMIAPDVLAGTPSASESGDELAMFVQQDASRIERIKKKYQPEKEPKDEDDEHDDYGFNRRPSVRGIKPRFGSTTEILQQIQNQLQPPSRVVAWPYYSESTLTDNTKTRNMNQMPNYQYSNVPEDGKGRCFATAPPQYRPTSLPDDNMYQNCSNQQRCVYRTNVNTSYATSVRVSGGCTEYYQSLPRTVRANGRPQSPPPLDMSKTYHQTMVYIPYNHIDGYQPVPPYYQQAGSDYARVSNQNQINKRYIEPIYQQQSRIQPQMVPRPNGQQILNCSRSESPLPGQFSTARSTQTPGTGNYYPRYRPVPLNWNMDGNYVTKMNRHSFPAGMPKYPAGDNVSLTDSESQHSGQMLLPNGFQRQEFGKDSMPNSPTKPRFIERGVPEGAASVSPQDTTQITSPTSPPNPTPSTKPLFYAMNV